jgi:alanine racemase
MVKADAYGLGAVPVVRTLEALGPWGYGVATIEEAEELRAAGVERPLMIFTPILPWDFAAARAARVIPVLGDAAAIAAWIDSGGGSWHLAIDTGMHRAGIPWWGIGDVAELVRRAPPAGACTHFHSAELNDGSVELQQRRFIDAIRALAERPPLLHAENSPALERQSPSPWSLARPGVFLYGVGGAEGSAVQPAPVVSLRARVVEVRDVLPGESVSYGATYRWRGEGGARGRVATLSLGYADGYRRAFGNRATVLMHGRAVPVAGVVTMDMTMVDVTGVPCTPGDVATLIGRDGDEELDVNRVARFAEMSPYELLTGLRQRLPRRYTSGAAGTGP